VATVVRTGAILFTDMVDSTALRSRLGEDRADQLRIDHDDLLRSVTDTHGGTVLRWTGDGMKAGFSTASDAVAAAVDIQRGIAAYVASDCAVAAFQVRIGISVGEVSISDDGDQRGMVVIEAARLEALARPGEILATDMVRLLGSRRAGVAFEALGERTLKGIDLPVLVHRVVDLERGSVPDIPRMLAADDRVPLVGRDAPLAEFTRAWDRSRLGEPGVMFVRGQAGIGKTRFLSHCAEVAHRSGALVLAGGCSSDVPVPYEPFAEAIRAVDGLDPLVAAAVDGTGPLARLFPAERSFPSDAELAGGRLDLFDAVTELVERLTVSQPVLLVLDDLHWATDATVLLLRHLVEQGRVPRLQLIAAYRDGDVEASHPMHDLPLQLAATAQLSVIDLSSLSERDVAQLVSAVAPAAPIARVAQVAELVRSESAGLPFFVSELITHLASTGTLDQPAGGASGFAVPDSLQNVVLQRVGRLPDGAKDVLIRAAVIGPTFELDILADVVEQPADDVLDVLDEVVRRGLLTEVGIDRFAFVHAIVRNALLDELSTSRRARAHRRVAEVLEARGADQFDELARHWQLGGEEGRSTQYLARAARRDMAALEFESAKHRYRQVIDQQDRSPGTSLVERAEAWLGYAGALRALGDSGYVSAVVRAAGLARSLRDARLMGEAAALSSWLGVWFYTSETREEDFIELCEDALAMLDEHDPMRVRVLATLASHLTAMPDSAPRRALIDEAIALAARHDDPVMTGAVLYAEFTCLWEPATLDRRQEITRALGRVARATGDATTDFLARYFTIYCAVERGELTGAREALVALRSTIDPSRRRYHLFLVERLIVAIDVLCCEAGTKERVDWLVVEFAEQEHDAHTSWTLHTGLLAFQSGTFGQLVNAVQAMTSGPQAHLWTAAHALALLWNGDVAEADALLDPYASPPRNYFWMLVTQAFAEVAAGVGRVDHCRRMFDELLPYRERIGVSGSGSACFGLVARTLGMLAIALGEPDTAIELLEDAIDRADRIGAIYDSVCSRRLLAEAHVAAGRPDRVLESLGDAPAIAAARGFARESALMQRLMQRD
jgi:class 3 adenylate cyclase/tetratricopeptide (TPR) repeat protein